MTHKILKLVIIISFIAITKNYADGSEVQFTEGPNSSSYLCSSRDYKLFKVQIKYSWTILNEEFFRIKFGNPIYTNDSIDLEIRIRLLQKFLSMDMDKIQQIFSNENAQEYTLLVASLKTPILEIYLGANAEPLISFQEFRIVLLEELAP